MVTKNSMIRLNKEIDATNFNDEKVMMNMEKGKYFSLNEVGSIIWDMIEGETAVKNIIKEMLVQYEVDEFVCEKEVVDYLEKLYQAELIQVIG